MVKGAWWHSKHFLFSFQVRLSFARKVRPRSMVRLTSWAGSAARVLLDRTTRVRMAEKRHRADLLVGIARSKRRKPAGGRKATGLFYAASNRDASDQSGFPRVWPATSANQTEWPVREA